MLFRFPARFCGRWGHPLVGVGIGTGALLAMMAIASRAGIAAPATAPATAPAAAPATQPATQPAAAPKPSLDAQTQDAIRHGVDFLLSAFKDGELPAENDQISTIRARGLHALCVYALLSAGQTISDPRLDPNGPLMKQLVEKLKSYDLSTRYDLPPQHITYARALRAAALALRNKPEDRKVLEADVAWLVAAHSDGGFSFDDRFVNATAQLTRNNNYPRNTSSGPNNYAIPGANSGAHNTTSSVPKQPPSAVGVGTWNHASSVATNSMYKPGANPVHVCHPSTSILLTHNYGIGAKPGIPAASAPVTNHNGAKMSSTPVGKGVAPISGGKIGVAPAGGGGGAKVAPHPGVAPGGGRPGMGVATPGGSDDPGIVEKVEVPWDNYNSQFAVMGIDAGADVGVNVPANLWAAVMKHWQTCQLNDGTWPYVTGEGGSLAMTAGGLASLIIGYDWRHRVEGMRRLTDDPMPDQVTRALEWLERSGNVVQIPTPTTDYVGLDAFTVLRAAQRFGLKYIGGHDWYHELAQRFVVGQFPNGSWGRASNMCGDTMIDTAYTVTFLSQGRRPPLMNKLRHDESEWQHHPHDLANLAKFATTDLEKPYRWQVVDLSHDGADWIESPILYITGENAPRLKPAEIAKIKAFVDAGGMIFTQADSRGRAFTDWVNKTLAPAILPAGAELKPLPDDHPIYNFGHKLKSKPKLLAAGNETRLLLVHSSQDLAAALDGPLDRDSRNTYELGVNLAIYAQEKWQKK